MFMQQKLKRIGRVWKSWTYGNLQKVKQEFVFYFQELTQDKTENQLKYSSIKTISNLQWKQTSKTLKEISENSDLIRKDCIPALWGRERGGGEGTLSPFLCTHVLEVLGFTTN